VLLSFLEFVNVSKAYGTVRVLHDVNFAIERAQVHALIGENGAGKSTLMKILAGFVPPTSGMVKLESQTLHFQNNRDAERAGIVLIHQEFNLIEDLSVAQNIFLGRELKRGVLLDTKHMNLETAKALSQVGLVLDPRTLVKDLIVPHKQMLEIAKALSRDAKILVMDEPTATLTPTETDVLFEIIARLKASGVTVVYISHKLDEVKRISDRVSVLRDGNFITTQETALTSEQEMASLMVGRDLEDMYPPKPKNAVPQETVQQKTVQQKTVQQEVVLEVQHLSVAGWAHDIHFKLHRGEILGFGGLVGSGRTELFEAMLGLRPHSSGTVSINNKPIQIRNPRDAAKAGLVYLSEDRKGKGLLLDFLLSQNLTLSNLQKFATPFLNRNAEHLALEKARDTYGIRVGDLLVDAKMLSGGNQQKLFLAKIMQLEPNIIVLDEPTRGVDVGAKREIYFLMHELVQQGKSIIVISSELPELLGLSHRLVVMRQGQIAGVLEAEHINENEVIQYATGLKSDQTINA
jgi:ribose transport system ATP-binding protein